jgi:catechol 2,3-dioxygenase-like lactoylglutathione lyase family enzyme
MLRIDHVNIHARDPKAMVAFLEAVLDAREGFRPAFPNPGHWVYLDDHPAIHIDYAAEGKDLNRGIFDHIAFGVYDFEPLLARVKATGFEHHLAGIPGGVGQIFVMGPEGIKIELQYHR